MTYINGKPAGYKIYYDSEKFVADTSPSAIENVPCDSTILWLVDADSAEHTARLNNAKLKDHFGFEVKKCKSCGEYFVQTYDERAWYEGNNLKPPKRCAGCRKIRKSLRK